MKKILITTAHPASYMDVWFNEMKKTFELTVVYNKVKSSEKLWKEQNFYKASLVSDLGYLKFAKIALKQDFVLLGGWNRKSNFLLILLLNLFGKKFGVFSDVPDEENIKPLKRILKKFFFMLIPKIFVTGNSGVDHFQKNYGLRDSKFVIFPYATELPDSELVDKVNQERKEKVLNNDEKIKIFIANRFIERKGYDTVLGAFEILKSENLLSNFSVEIAGVGEQFQLYEEKFSQLNSNISLVGWIEVNDYYSKMMECDIYIHASKFEPYGIPVLDAMARGKLVIASTGVMSAVDHIESMHNGILYDKTNSKELAAILRQIESDRQIISSIGIEAMKRSFEFSAETNVINLQSIMF